MNEPASPPSAQAEIRPCSLSLTAAERAALKRQRPCCIWLTGLSGAGKSTLANLLELRLNGQGLHTFILDGDNVRSGLCRDLGMGAEARKENIRRLAGVARLMVEAGLIVIVSAISPFRAERAAARALFAADEFIEVYVSTAFAVCARRDPKGLYRAASEGRIRDFTGLDSPYEAPLAPDCEIDTETVGLALATERIMALLLNK